MAFFKTKPKPKQLCVRWMLRGHYPEVVEMEQLNFRRYWKVDDFAAKLRDGNTVGRVAEVDGATVGYMVYELYQHCFHVSRLAVHPSTWRRGIGRAMVNELITKLAPSQRTRIHVAVPETCIEGLLFFQKQGFVAQGFLNEWFEGEAAVAMVYRREQG